MLRLRAAGTPQGAWCIGTAVRSGLTGRDNRTARLERPGKAASQTVDIHVLSDCHV